MTATPEIEQHHINRMQAIAHDLAKTKVGSRAGQEELESQGLLILWELALAWSPDSGAPFAAYIHMQMRNRLVDWLRREYGSRIPERLAWNMNMNSLDEVLEAVESHENAGAQHAASLADPRPSVEQQVEDRDELHRLMEWVNEHLTPLQRISLLWPAWSRQAEGGQTVRVYVKQDAAAAIGRPLSKHHTNPRTGQGRRPRPPNPGAKSAMTSKMAERRLCPECGEVYGRRPSGMWAARCQECKALRVREQKAASARHRYDTDAEHRERIKAKNSEAYWADIEKSRAWHRDRYYRRREEARSS